MDIVIIEVLFPIKGKEAQLQGALNRLAEAARSSVGCVQYDLFVPFDEKSECMIIMRFDCEEHLRRHEGSEYINEFVKENEGKTYDNFTYSKWKSPMESQ